MGLDGRVWVWKRCENRRKGKWKNVKEEQEQCEKKRTHGQGRMECEREKKSIKGRTGVLKCVKWRLETGVEYCWEFSVWEIKLGEKTGRNNYNYKFILSL